jgi:hypothetical protein
MITLAISIAKRGAEPKKSLTFLFEIERITQSFRGELSPREEIFCRMEVKSVT